MNSKNIVILFPRLSDYMLNVFSHWVESDNVKLYIFRRPIDLKECPYEFKALSNKIELFDCTNYDLDSLKSKVIEINPKMIICGGWADRNYLKVVKLFSGKIPTVMTMDNHFKGTLKQKLATFIARFFLLKLFSDIWVPGKPQVEYAKKLGFSSKNIHQGFYVANNKNFDIEIINKERKLSKKFLFLGRYVEIKGINDLWEAFIELKTEFPNDWELDCIGTGPLWNNKVEHKDIHHIGFVQPEDLNTYLKEGGVFVLPSHKEPWGLVVHELATAGYPLLLSDQIGASTEFLDGNGFVFTHGNIASIKKALKTIMLMEENELIKMRDISIKLSKNVTKEQWVKTSIQIQDDFYNVPEA